MAGRSSYLLRLLFCSSIALLASACGGGSSSDSGGSSGTSVPALLANYVGTWVASCTTDAPSVIYTLSINSSGQYWLLAREYDSAANCGDDANLANSQISTSVTATIEANTSNSQYNDFYLTNSEVRMTAHSASQVSSWISSAQCDKTDWSVGSEAEFNASSSGNGCFQTSTRAAMQLSGSTLLMNTRGGFDGGDPPDIVFTKQSASPLLTGKIGGTAWMVVSGKVSAGFDAGTLSYTLYDTYVPDICNTFYFSSRSVVLFSLPEATGSYSLGLSSNTVTLYDGSTNYIVTSGSVEIDTLTAGQAAGSMDATYDSNNSVSGEFALTRCP